VGYQASNITLFLSKTESFGYNQIPDQDQSGGDSKDLSGSDDQNILCGNADHAGFLNGLSIIVSTILCL